MEYLDDVVSSSCVEGAAEDAAEDLVRHGAVCAVEDSSLILDEWVSRP